MSADPTSMAVPCETRADFIPPSKTSSSSSKAELPCFGRFTRFVPPFRTALHTSVAVLLMGSLALPLADKIVTMKTGPTTSIIHYEYLPATYRYWREKTVRESSLKRTRSSLGLVAAGTSFIAFMPVLAMLRLDIPLLIMLALNFFIFLYSVANMRIGYHFFNESAGARQVGELKWGPSQTLHSAVAFILLCLLIFLSIEQCCIRCCGSLATQTKWGNKWLSPMRRRVVLVVPILVALVLAVTGDGTAQAINHKNPAYTTAWHYSLMSYDYSLGYVRENFCPEFFRTLSGASIVLALACIFAFVGAVLSLFMVGKSTTASIVMAILALIFTIGAVGITSELRNAITCEAPYKPQGKLRLTQGFICACGALVLGLVNVIVSIVTRNITEEYVDAAAVLPQGVFPACTTQSYAIAGDTEPINETCEGVVIAVTTSTQHLPARPTPIDDELEEKAAEEDAPVVVVVTN